MGNSSSEYPELADSSVIAIGRSKSDGSSDCMPNGEVIHDHPAAGHPAAGHPAGRVLWPSVPHQLAVSAKPGSDDVGNITSKLRL